MDFNAAWNRIEVGEQVVVRNGQPEPTSPDSLDWKVWASWNYTGELMEKISAEPRLLRFQVTVGDLAVLSYEVAEAPGYSFERLAPDLADVQEIRTAEVDVLWRAILNDVCPCTVGGIDSNEESRLFVAGAVTMATIATANNLPFSIRWRLKNNGYATLDAAGMVQLGMELGAFVNACCQARFDAKDAIQGAQTVQEVQAIDVQSFFAGLSGPISSE